VREDEILMTRQPRQQQQRALTTPPDCPKCGRAMRVFGIEPHPLQIDQSLVSYECDCGHVLTVAVKRDNNRHDDEAS
jgi:hypothetical protein